MGSGGIRGIAHVGVLKTLLKHDIPIDFIAGSSIGAWVGAHYALFQDLETLESLTVGSRLEKLDALFEPSLRGGLAGGEKTKALLTQWLGDASFEQTKIPLALVATDLGRREAHVFSTGALVPAVQASMAIPGLFKPVLYRGRAFIDGGISNPVPNDLMKDMGADIIIGVNLYHLPEDAHARGETDFGLMDVTKASIEIMRYYLAKHSMSLAHVAIEPSLEEYADWGRYFMEGNGQKIVAIGEAETEKIIPALKELLA